MIHFSEGGVGVGEELLDWNKFYEGYEDPIFIQFYYRYEIFWNSFMISILRIESMRL